MKKVFNNATLFILLALAFSGLAGCNGSETSQQPSNTSANGDGAKKKSEYPPLAAAIAQADIKNLDGTTFKVADKKGKVLLLNLWATWCGPCRSEMPTLIRMQDTYRDQGFEVIGLDTDDETVEDINRFSNEMKLNYPLVWADTKLQTSLLNISKFDGIPQSFLVDRDGNLRAVFRGANPSDVKKMEEWVGKVVNGEETETVEKTVSDASSPVNGTVAATSKSKEK